MGYELEERKTKAIVAAQPTGLDFISASKIMDYHSTAME